MKGVLFNALFQMVEQQMGDAVLEHMIEGAQLSHMGSYTSGGNYPDSELEVLLEQLHRQTGISSAKLLQELGKFHWHYLQKAYPNYFDAVSDAFTLLGLVETYLHTEAKKMYPDANLPVCQVEAHTSEKIILLYESSRPMSDMLAGIIEAVLDHYQEKARVEVFYPHGKKNIAKFIITRL